MRKWWQGSAIALAILSGCSDPVADCGAACVPAEAELRLSDLTVLHSGSDVVTGLAVVQPNAIDVRVVVVNDGPGPSMEKPLIIELRGNPPKLVSVPALAAGRRYERTVRLDAPAAGFVVGPDTVRITATVVVLDQDASNHTQTTAAFHLAVPSLQLVAVLDTTHIVANIATRALIRITNTSRHASLSEATIGMCIHDLGGWCADVFNPTAFGRLSVPPIAAGESIEIAVPVAVPSMAADQNRIDALMLSTCLGPPGVSATALVNARTCLPAEPVVIRPDYEACTPVQLVEDMVVQGRTTCTTPCQVFVYSVTVREGFTYVIETPEGVVDQSLRWRTRHRDNPDDASPAFGFQPESSGALYLVTAPKYCYRDHREAFVLRVLVTPEEEEVPRS